MSEEPEWGDHGIRREDTDLDECIGSRECPWCGGSGRVRIREATGVLCPLCQGGPVVEARKEEILSRLESTCSFSLFLHFSVLVPHICKMQQLDADIAHTLTTLEAEQAARGSPSPSQHRMGSRPQPTRPRNILPKSHAPHGGGGRALRPLREPPWNYRDPGPPQPPPSSPQVAMRPHHEPQVPIAIPPVDAPVAPEKPSAPAPAQPEQPILFDMAAGTEYTATPRVPAERLSDQFPDVQVTMPPPGHPAVMEPTSAQYSVHTDHLGLNPGISLVPPPAYGQPVLDVHAGGRPFDAMSRDPMMQDPLMQDPLAREAHDDVLAPPDALMGNVPPPPF